MTSDTETSGVTKFIEPGGYRSLSRQLHQTTQPLCVLEGLLELSLVEAHTVDEYKHSVERALEELDRVVGCFQGLRNLIAIGQCGETGRQNSETKDV